MQHILNVLKHSDIVLVVFAKLAVLLAYPLVSLVQLLQSTTTLIFVALKLLFVFGHLRLETVSELSQVLFIDLLGLLEFGH
jgi:hypothetical protein